MTFLIFLIVLTVLVLVHELGHFLVAKKFGIKVEEFGFGFPPRAFARKIGETVYSINWLPIGGFVKLYGEDSAGGGRLKISRSHFAKASRDKAFYARPAWQKALIVAAGVFMNFALSVLIYSFLFAAVGVEVAGDKVLVNQVIKGSPADLAGIKAGDRIVYINSVKITTTEQLIDETRKNLGKEITLRLASPRSDSGQAGQAEKEIKITPRKDYPKNQGPMGIAIYQNIEVKKYAWYQSPFAATVEALKTSWLIIVGFGMAISTLITSGNVPGGIAGPVGIAQLTGRIAEIGPFAVLSFVSLLSLNLAIINILPIPALDGGRLFFILIEMVTRRRVHPRFESYTHAIGMALLLALIALVTFHDLTRLLSGQPILPKQ